MSESTTGTDTATTKAATAGPSDDELVTMVTAAMVAYADQTIDLDDFHSIYRSMHHGKRSTIQPLALSDAIELGVDPVGMLKILSAVANVPVAVASRAPVVLTSSDRFAITQAVMAAIANDVLGIHIAGWDAPSVLTACAAVAAENIDATNGLMTAIEVAIANYRWDGRTRSTGGKYDTTVQDLFAGGVVTPGTELVGRRKGIDYRAVVNGDGTVSAVAADGTVSPTSGALSAVATDQTGSSTNGWDFYHVGRHDGVLIGSLR